MNREACWAARACVEPAVPRGARAEHDGVRAGEELVVDLHVLHRKLGRLACRGVGVVDLDVLQVHMRQLQSTNQSALIILETHIRCPSLL